MPTKRAFASMMVSSIPIESMMAGSFSRAAQAAISRRCHLDYAHDQRPERWPARLMLAAVE
jgi:hypothetical protein